MLYKLKAYNMHIRNESTNTGNGEKDTHNLVNESDNHLPIEEREKDKQPYEIKPHEKKQLLRRRHQTLVWSILWKY